MPGTRMADRYTPPAIFFHWAIAILIALAYLAIEIRGPRGAPQREFWSNVHFWAGTLVVSLAVLRLLWRCWAGAPEEIDGNPLLRFLARLVHVALYVFIFAQPLLGMLMINAGGHPVHLAWLDVSFTLVPEDKIARPLIKNAHVFLGNAFYWVIGVHAFAAIAHHVVFKDRTLKRMIGS